MDKYDRDTLLGALANRGLVNKEVVLASGVKANCYLDCRRVTMSGLFAMLAGSAIFNRVRSLYPEAIGGPAAGAVSLVTATVIAASREGSKHMEGFYTRKETKQHGLQQIVEGKCYHGQRVVIIDDVMTSGGSALDAANAARAFGLDVIGFSCLVDRQAGAAEAIAKWAAEIGKDNVQYLPLFTLAEVEAARMKHDA